MKSDSSLPRHRKRQEVTTAAQELEKRRLHHENPVSSLRLHVILLCNSMRPSPPPTAHRGRLTHRGWLESDPFGKARSAPTSRECPGALVFRPRRGGCRANAQTGIPQGSFRHYDPCTQHVALNFTRHCQGDGHSTQRQRSLPLPTKNCPMHLKCHSFV